MTRPPWRRPKKKRRGADVVLGRPVTVAAFNVLCEQVRERQTWRPGAAERTVQSDGNSDEGTREGFPYAA